jgi:hypothetical protein
VGGESDGIATGSCANSLRDNLQIHVAHAAFDRGVEIAPPGAGSVDR